MHPLNNAGIAAAKVAVSGQVLFKSDKGTVFKAVKMSKIKVSYSNVDFIKLH